MRRLAWVLGLLIAGCSAPAPIDGGSDVVASDVVASDVGGDAATPSDVQADHAEPADVARDGQAPDAPPCVDGDGDGYGAGCAAGADCNDGDRNIHPGAAETCDGVDSNCDGDADATQSAELDAWCRMTAPTIPACDEARPTLCRNAGDVYATSGFQPYAAPWCISSCRQSGASLTTQRCWRDPSRVGDCPLTP